MTERLYYTDAYLTTFSAAVIAIDDDGRRVYLDRSAFYPTSGGQPHDLGLLNGVAVVDVIEEDDRVAHLLAAPLRVVAGVTVEGVIDATRRFDNMQQHTGQHLLSALFADRYGWPTVSVHFGDETSTIDINGTGLDNEMLRDVELLANSRIVENRDVTVSFEDSATATGLRKPSDRDGTLRIVTIDDFDRSACGGTHVRRTGEIGSMLLRRAERAKGNTRVEFICGTRAVKRARLDAELLTTAARIFTAAPDDVPGLVEKQQQRTLDLERENRRLATELARYDARVRWEAATPDVNGTRRIRLSLDSGPVRDLEPLAQALTALGHALVLITSSAPAGVMLGSSVETNVDAGQTLRAALATAGGRGGGSPRLAQGSLPDAHAIPSLATNLGFL